MDRLQVSFAALLVVSLSLGGITAFDLGDRFGEIDSIGVVKSQVAVEVADFTLHDRSLQVTVRIQNPTAMDLRVTGAQFRLFNQTNQRLASGAGSRIDSGPSVVAARDTLVLTYQVGLSERQHRRARNSLSGGASLSMNFAMRLGETSFVIRTTAPVGGGGR